MTTQTPVQRVKEQAAKTEIVSVFDFIKMKRSTIEDALPKHIGIERFIAMFTIVVNSNPELSKCTPASLIGALVQTTQLGLMPGIVNHCYYVPFNNKKQINGEWKTLREVQFILGYKGMIELVNRSREAAILSTEVVYENDLFNYELGLNPTLKHVPVWDDRGKAIGVYCVAKNLLANEKLFIYLQKEDIEKVRGASKAKDSEYSPWSKWWEEMAKKTAIKRICKLLPLAIDVQKKISTDETVKETIAADMTEVVDATNWDEKETIEHTPTPEENAAVDKELAK